MDIERMTPTEIKAENERQREVNIQKMEQMDRKMERQNNLFYSLMVLQQTQEKESFERANAKAQQHFKEDKIVDFMFFAVFIMLTSYAILLFGSAVWKADYAGAVYASPFAAISLILTVGFYRIFVAVKFKPLTHPVMLLKAS